MHDDSPIHYRHKFLFTSYFTDVNRLLYKHKLKATSEIEEICVKNKFCQVDKNVNKWWELKIIKNVFTLFIWGIS